MPIKVSDKGPNARENTAHGAPKTTPEHDFGPRLDDDVAHRATSKGRHCSPCVGYLPGGTNPHVAGWTKGNGMLGAGGDARLVSGPPRTLKSVVFLFHRMSVV